MKVFHSGVINCTLSNRWNSFRVSNSRSELYTVAQGVPNLNFGSVQRIDKLRKKIPQRFACFFCPVFRESCRESFNFLACPVSLLDASAIQENNYQIKSSSCASGTASGYNRNNQRDIPNVVKM